MYIDRSRFDEYSFSGQFYTVGDYMPEDGDILGVKNEEGYIPESGDAFSGTEDTAKPDTGHTPSPEDAETETIIYETICDIQDTDKIVATSTAGSYLDIFFPFDTAKGVPVRIGHRFRCDDWSRPVDGRVYAVVPSPMGGCKARIKEVGIDDLHDGEIR